MTRRRTILVCFLVVALASLAVSAASSSTFGTKFRTGTEIQFRVDDSTTWWWGCCSCSDSQVLGWRVTTSTGLVVYNVVHDAPVPASTWVGTWTQVDINAAAVAAGMYVLYVDTSAGTLSRCFTIYDACGCSSCSSPCWSCQCQEVPTITTCACRTSLVFVDTCTTGCCSFFGWFGCGCTSCSGGCGNP